MSSVEGKERKIKEFELEEVSVDSTKNYKCVGTISLRHGLCQICYPQENEGGQGLALVVNLNFH